MARAQALRDFRDPALPAIQASASLCRIAGALGAEGQAGAGPATLPARSWLAPARDHPLPRRTWPPSGRCRRCCAGAGATATPTPARTSRTAPPMPCGCAPAASTSAAACGRASVWSPRTRAIPTTGTRPRRPTRSSRPASSARTAGAGSGPAAASSSPRTPRAPCGRAAPVRGPDRVTSQGGHGPAPYSPRSSSHLRIMAISASWALMTSSASLRTSGSEPCSSTILAMSMAPW